MYKVEPKQVTITKNVITEMKCCKCGKEIEHEQCDHATINLNIQWTDIRQPYYQLCEECTEKLYDWFDYRKENDTDYLGEKEYYFDD